MKIDGMNQLLARLHASALTAALLACAFAASACAKADRPGSLGGETNWLKTCRDDSSCAQGSCLCGVCTQACGTASECSGKFSGSCVETASAGWCADGAPPSAAVCLPSCVSSAECGAGYRCEHSNCVPASDLPAGRNGSVAGAAAADARAAGAGGTGAADAGRGAAGASTSAGECNTAADCVLVAMGCCAPCQAHTTDYNAVSTTEQTAAERRACPGGPVACGPCAPAVGNPMRPILRAACIQQKCTVIDERLSDAAACQSNTDCTLLASSCCGGCGPDPSSWISLNVPTDPLATACTGQCSVCGDTRKPEAFCASDAHCAVREVSRVNGELSSTCFSPTQNLEHAYDSGSVGCDCYVAGPNLCLSDATGRKVALSCQGPAPWRALNDGACAQTM